MDPGATKLNRFSGRLRAFHASQPKAPIGQHHPALLQRDAKHNGNLSILEFVQTLSTDNGWAFWCPA